MHNSHGDGMKLKVIINTFKRPAQALAVIQCLRAMSSGKHEVKYVVAYDKEDWMTGQFFPPASREDNPPSQLLGVLCKRLHKRRGWPMHSRPWTFRNNLLASSRSSWR
jgi:hypothetical protein